MVWVGVGVDKRSVDAWMHPSNFRMNVSTGAPPDMFAKMGQNWGECHQLSAQPLHTSQFSLNRSRMR